MWSIKLLPTACGVRKLILYLAFDRIPIGICLFRIRCVCVCVEYSMFLGFIFPAEGCFCRRLQLTQNAIWYQCDSGNGSLGRVRMRIRLQFFRCIADDDEDTIFWSQLRNDNRIIIIMNGVVIVDCCDYYEGAFASIRRLLHDNPEDI